MAEDERQRIVKRANDGRTAAKAKGIKLGRIIAATAPNVGNGERHQSKYSDVNQSLPLPSALVHSGVGRAQMLDRGSAHHRDPHCASVLCAVLLVEEALRIESARRRCAGGENGQKRKCEKDSLHGNTSYVGSGRVT
jgi:hypothetical protein